MQKKVIQSVVLFFVLSIILSSTAFATDSRASSRFAKYSAELFSGNDGNLYVLFSVTASNTMDILGTSNIAIQRYDSSRWVTECTLTVKNTPEMQTSNAVQYYASIPYTPSYSNAKYRAVVTFYAEDSSGSSTVQATTK